jgi:hypothetical protein
MAKCVLATFGGATAEVVHSRKLTISTTWEMEIIAIASICVEICIYLYCTVWVSMMPWRSIYILVNRGFAWHGGPTDAAAHFHLFA